MPIPALAPEERPLGVFDGDEGEEVGDAKDVVVDKIFEDVDDVDEVIGDIDEDVDKDVDEVAVDAKEAV